MQPKIARTLSILLFIGLLLWGTYTTLSYLGVPVHDAVLLTDAQNKTLDAAVSAMECTREDFLCRGMQAFFPFLGNTIARASPFLWYAIVSLLLYSIYLGWHFLKRGALPTRFTFRPWTLLTLFLGSLWILFTALGFGESGDAGVPMRRMFEPSKEVYLNAGEEVLRELQANFASLQERGCLAEIGRTQNGTGVYNISHLCFQSAFVTRVLPLVLFIVILLFEFLIVGRVLLRLLRVPEKRPLFQAVLGVGLGACAWIVALWVLAVLGIFTDTAGWVLAFAVPVLLYRESLAVLRQFTQSSWTTEIRWYDPTVLLGWLLLSYLALNFLNVVRPFPIGWDDLGSYLNRPRLLVSYGHFIFSMSQFQWEYLTSLGFLLFGYDSTFGATASMMVNWAAGLLAVAVVFTVTNVFLGKKSGLLAALLYYALPLVGHFSFADMKIDNAVFVMGALSALCVLLFLFPMAEDDEENAPFRYNWRILLLAGVFSGFAFAMKPTAIMVTMGLGSILLGVLLHPLAFLGVMVLAFLVFIYRGVLNFPRLLERVTGSEAASVPSVVLLIGAALAITILGFSVLRRRVSLRAVLISCGVFIGGFLLSIAPWVYHNDILGGSFIPKLVLTPPNTISPHIDLTYTTDTLPEGSDLIVLPPALAVDPHHFACKATGSREELDRYWGFRTGWGHYLTLPWRTVLNVDSAGYYVTTMPALLLFPFLFLLPYMWSRKGRWCLWLLLGTAFMIIQWMFLANGILWYGVGMFLGLVVGLEMLIARSPDLSNRILSTVLIVIALFVSFGNRFWQFELQRNIFEYPLGKISAAALEERTISHYNDIRSVVVERYRMIPDRPYLYRIGTFIPYFIPKNLEIIANADHQLDFFTCLNQEKDHALTVQRLKALGFNSIIFDTNTATIERDPNGTLHQKVNAFVNFVNDPVSGLQLVVNDPNAGVAFLLIP